MALDDGWELPALETIFVTEEELLLLDWVMCSASGLIPNATIEDLVTNWTSFRYDVLKSLSSLSRQRNVKSPPISPALETLPIDEFTARTLLALVPTTFRWGTGVDCGYDLKLKLYRFLVKEVEVDASDTENQADSSSQDESTGSTGSGA